MLWFIERCHWCISEIFKSKDYKKKLVDTGIFEHCSWALWEERGRYEVLVIAWWLHLISRLDPKKWSWWAWGALVELLDRTMRSHVILVYNWGCRSGAPVICVEPELMPLSFEAVKVENLCKREIHVFKEHIMKTSIKQTTWLLVTQLLYIHFLFKVHSRLFAGETRGGQDKLLSSWARSQASAWFQKHGY